MTISIYRDIEDRVIYYQPNKRFFEVLTDEWEAAPAHDKWGTLLFEVVGDDFNLMLQSPSELDPTDLTFDRRERILKERYGEKPIEYPK